MKTLDADIDNKASFYDNLFEKPDNLKINNTDIADLSKNEGNLYLNGNTYKSVWTKSINDYFQNPINLSRAYLFISNIFFIISGIFMKTYSSIFDYPILHFCTCRFIFLTITSYIYIVYFKSNANKNLTTTVDKLSSNNDNSNEIVSLYFTGTQQKWYFIRLFSFIGCMIVGIYLFNTLKLGIAHLMIQIAPIVTNILASIFINDSFNMKYTIACILCFVGIAIMVSSKESVNNLNEMTTSVKENSSKEITFLGLILAVINSIMLGFINLTAKILSKEFDPFSMNYVNGFWGSLFFIIVCILFSDAKYLLSFIDIKLIAFSLSNAVFHMFGLAFVQKSFSLVDISKVSYIFYLQVPIATIIGIIFFNEFILLNEIIGGVLVLGTITIITIF